MTKQESIKILAMLEANYQPFKNMTEAVDLWSSAFAEDRFEFVQTAVMAIIQTDPSEFRPNVAKVRRKMHDIVYGEPISETEAWLKIKSAMHEAQEEPETLGGAKRAWKSLPEDLQKLVTPRQLYDWNSLESGTVDTIIQGRLMKSYADVRDRKYQREALPKGMQNVIGAIREKVGLFDDPDKKPELPEPKKVAYEKPDWMLRREAEGWNIE